MLFCHWVKRQCSEGLIIVIFLDRRLYYCPVSSPPLLGAIITLQKIILLVGHQHFHSISFPRVFHSWGKILKSENEIWRVKVLRCISQRYLSR